MKFRKKHSNVREVLNVAQQVLEDTGRTSGVMNSEIFMHAYRYAEVENWQAASAWAFQKFLDEGCEALPSVVENYCIDVLAGRIDAIHFAPS